MNLKLTKKEVLNDIRGTRRSASYCSLQYAIDALQSRGCAQQIGYNCGYYGWSFDCCLIADEEGARPIALATGCRNPVGETIKHDICKYLEKSADRMSAADIVKATIDNQRSKKNGVRPLPRKAATQKETKTMGENKIEIGQRATFKNGASFIRNNKNFDATAPIGGSPRFASIAALKKGPGVVKSAFARLMEGPIEKRGGKGEATFAPMRQTGRGQCAKCGKGRAKEMLEAIELSKEAIKGRGIRAMAKRGNESPRGGKPGECAKAAAFEAKTAKTARIKKALDGGECRIFGSKGNAPPPNNARANRRGRGGGSRLPLLGARRRRWGVRANREDKRKRRRDERDCSESMSENHIGGLKAPLFLLAKCPISHIKPFSAS